MKNIKCKNCNSYVREWCDSVIDSPDPDLVRDCPYFSQITNVDRIRAMSDEQLVGFLYKFAHSNNKPLNQRNLLEWLRQPVEEETENDA